MFRRETVKLTFVCLTALAIVVTLFAWSVQRRRARIAQTRELETLYTSAAGGDLTKLKQLSQHPSPEAISWLRKLAEDQGGFAETRAAAIKLLGGKASVGQMFFAPLIQIDQPFGVRHAAAEAFKDRGCDEQCISAALTAIHSLWKGELPIEAGFYAELQRQGVHPDAALHAKTTSELRSKTEQDYRDLLNANACLARKTLEQSYPSEPSFIEFVEAKISPC